jgi:chlorophyllide a reductase subunit Z
MGYAGATYIVQEYVNALFDALFHMIPLGTELDRVAATPAKEETSVMPWDDRALIELDRAVIREPYLVRISAAKRLREKAEAEARAAGETRVNLERLRSSLGANRLVPA